MSISTIDPVARFEGHLRIEMEVPDGVLSHLRRVPRFSRQRCQHCD